MLTKNDLNRKKFNLSELNKIPDLVFTPNENIKLPSNLDTLLYLLRQIQTRNFYEKFQIEQRLLELKNQEPNDEGQLETDAINQKLLKIEYSRHRLHTIYTQILLHLFHTDQLKLLYVQSHESQPDVRNVLAVNFGGHTHRFQIKRSLLQGKNLEDRGVRYRQEPTTLEPITDQQVEEYGYQIIDVIRECRRISNYLTNRMKTIKEKNAKINTHNMVVAEIKKMAKTGQVTIIDNTKPEKAVVETPIQTPKAPDKQKQVQPKVNPVFKKSGNARPASSTSEQPAKKPINVIRKRSFQLNK